MTFTPTHYRKTFPIFATHIPMNACSQAPQTDVTRKAAERYLDSWNRAGMDWAAWMAEVNAAKAAFASLINADADEIAVFSSVSEAASALASALSFGNRSGVLTTEAEFPSIGHVWLAQEPLGAHVRWVPVTDGVVDIDDYRIDANTALVSATHGYYLNGFVQDIAQLAARTHAEGALLFVDAYQTMGAVPIDVKASNVDFLASGNLKYLMGVPGIAFLYVRRDLLQYLRPTVTGWFGRAQPFAFDPKTLDWSPTASRLDTGTPPIINAYIARAGMELIREIGVDAIHAWHMTLSQRLLDGGAERGFTLHGTTDATQKTATTAFVVEDAHSVEATMRTHGVIASARGPVIRLAPHFYNTLEDMDTALDVLADALA